MKIEKFEHYLLTCFNLDRGFDPDNKRNSLEYLEQRFSIFESITVPSVAAQSCSNFSWLVFFDPATPEQYKFKAEALLKSVKSIPVYVKNIKEIKEFITNKLKNKTEYLITTNLDNDDAISENFIKLIQSNLKQEEVYMINLPIGYMISQKGLLMREFFSSPFHTLSEKVSNEIITCLDIPHVLTYMLQKEDVPVYQIISEPSWLQIIHKSNVSNSLDINAVPIFNLKTLQKFNVKKLPFDPKGFVTNETNRFNLTISWFKKKKSQSLSLKLKLAVYTLVPQSTIWFNKYKQNILRRKQPVNNKYDLCRFKKLISDLKEKEGLQYN